VDSDPRVRAPAKNNAGVTRPQCTMPSFSPANMNTNWRVLAWRCPDNFQWATWFDRVLPSATRDPAQPGPAAPAIGRHAPSESIGWPSTRNLARASAFQLSPDQSSCLLQRESPGPSFSNLFLQQPRSLSHQHARFVCFLNRGPYTLVIDLPIGSSGVLNHLIFLHAFPWPGFWPANNRGCPKQNAVPRLGLTLCPPR
jgi:hypothetical protein